jgi:hypothetical protein
MEGYFIALVVIGNKEMTETELLIPSCTEYVKNLYHDAPFSLGGKWLMIHVTDSDILKDTKELIKIRVSPKKR